MVRWPGSIGDSILTPSVDPLRIESIVVSSMCVVTKALSGTASAKSGFRDMNHQTS